MTGIPHASEDFVQYFACRAPCAPRIARHVLRSPSWATVNARSTACGRTSAGARASR